MNLKMMCYILGKMLGVEALLLLLPAFVGLIYQERSGIYFLITAGILAVLFLLTGIKKPENRRIYGKEGMVIVAVVWILWSLFGALPFTLSGSIPSYIDAFFETVSGFTTTGSTILKDLEALPQCMLFWRSFTHWVGGMGVLVFAMMLTSLDKESGMYLMRAEVPGPEKDKLVPKMKETARILYGMYLGLSIVLVVLLLLGGMNLFDSLIHMFGTAGTGGFSNYAISVGHFDSAYIDIVLSVFMILFGVNFGLYFLLLLRDFKPVWKNEELRAYLLIITITTLLIAVDINEDYPNFLQSLRYSLFQVASIITTTGYATTDFNYWPMFSKWILILLMVIGACASSTGGGIKVSRGLVVLKTIKRAVKQMIHPKSVSIIRLNDKKMSQETLRNVYSYLMAYAVIAAGSVILVSLDDMDMETTLSAVMTTLNNVGPGLAVAGPMGSFADFSVMSKIIFSIDMLIGRLEIFPFLILFTAFAWRKKF
ncbi:MAG TPA: TrkH family potassium uptake protein [Candidatus Dorea gallistercoris]|uniref:TrkH family potassium uptake protein n=1 Tax=Candidatus Dorea gallistercoris TaxID=2838542 RepID=A0A9D1UCM4_9FIRM|nr:TrkH family potassium uptake protein [Candidatus Dorea gallistercoris]